MSSTRCTRCGGPNPLPCTRRGRGISGETIGEMVFLCQGCWRRGGRESSASLARRTMSSNYTAYRRAGYTGELPEELRRG